MDDKKVEHKRSTTRKWLTTVLLVTGNIVFWLIPDNVTYLIAQNRDVLLGRYSIDRFTALILLIPITFVILYLTWANENNKKERKFKVIAVTLSFMFSLTIADIVMRLMEPKVYVHHKEYFHRKPDQVDTGTTHDTLQAAVTYAESAPGYPDIQYTLTTDKRGFRNSTDLEQYDVVTLGDSFTEGAGVSDNQIWPVLFGQKSNLSVYNLGMSSGFPETYWETLRRFGINLKPKIVFCMVYEGNDFRDESMNEKGIWRTIDKYFYTSPIRRKINDLMIKKLGSSKSDSSSLKPDSNISMRKPAATQIIPLANTQVTQQNVPIALSWLPIALPEGPQARYYTFKVKMLTAHFSTQKQFTRSAGWRKCLKFLDQIKTLCDQNNIRLVLVFAPDKAHILMPLLKDRVSGEQLHAFMSLHTSKLPAPDKLWGALLDRLEVQENALKAYCEKNSIEFLSLTEPMRTAVAEGRQVYFTYDQHWTPVGNEIAADVVYEYVKEHP